MLNKKGEEEEEKKKKKKKEKEEEEDEEEEEIKETYSYKIKTYGQNKKKINKWSKLDH